METLARSWLALRVVALVTGCSGLIALTADRFAPAATAGLLLVAAGGCYVSAHADAAPWSRLSQVASASFLAVFAGVAAWQVYAQAHPVTGVLEVFTLGVFLAHCYAQRTRRDVLVGVIISVFMAVLPAGVATASNVRMPLILCWLGAVTALVIAHQVAQWEAAGAVAVRHESVAIDGVNPVSRMAVAVAVAMVLGLLVFLALPRPSGLTARRNLARGLPGGFSSQGRVPSRGVDYYSGGSMDLRTRGTLPDTPVLDVPADSPGLWRGASLDSYDGGTWTQQVAPLHVVADRSGYAVSDDPATAGLPRRPQRSDEVRVRSSFGFLVVAPGTPERIATRAQLTNGPFGIVLLDRRGTGTYVVLSSSTEAEPALLSAADGPDADPIWTALPPIPARVSNLATSLASPTGDRLGTVRAVERALRERATYRLDSPVPPSGADAVDHFLFDARTGFCEQFASAEVVLLRSLGIPARLVTGFAGGEPAENGRRLVLASNAHAWVEVWFPGVGWVSSDPTAGTTLAEPSTLSRLVSAAGTLLSTARGRVIIAVGLLAVCLVLWGGWWLMRRRRPSRLPRRPTVARGPLWAAFGRLEAALAATGKASPPAETLSELSHRVTSRPDESRALGVLERACYSGTNPTPEDQRAAAQTIDDLAARLLVSGTG